jgi:hypothetical protein
MREKLKELEGQRLVFQGVFDRFGVKKAFGYQKDTLLVKNVTLKGGEEVTDHLWFTVGKIFDSLNLKQGDKIEFEGRIKEYIKGGYYDREENYQYDFEIDYKIANPSKVRKI